MAALLRGPSINTYQAAGTSGCLQHFCSYIQERRGELLKDQRPINEGNAVAMMIDLMRQRGFPGLTMTTASSFYSKLFSNTFTRDDLFDAILAWTNESLQYSTRDLRGYIDSSISLSLAVKLSDSTYYTTLNSAMKANSYEECNPVEREHVNWVLANNGLYHSKPQNNKTINKTQCGTCWICNTPIYQYWVWVLKDVKKELNACGEDEHVLTPGYGTLVGTLLFTPTELIDVMQATPDSKKSLLNVGLRPSHTFCNRAKSDLKFISSPSPSRAGQYTANTVNIENCIENMRSMLRQDTVLSFELQFKKSTKPDETFLKNTRESVNTYISNLCRIANSVVDLSGKTGSATPYNTAFLKAIFITCVTAVKVYPTELGRAWTKGTKQKKGGKNQLIKGGQITDHGQRLRDFLDSNITDDTLTSLVISDVCLDLDDKFPDVDEMETMQQQQPASSNWGWTFGQPEGQPQGVFSFVPLEEQSQQFQSKQTDRKSAKKVITSEEGRAHRAEAAKEKQIVRRETDIRNWRLQNYNRVVNPQGGTRHNHKTQRRSYHKKDNKTLKKNKRPARKTQRRRRN